MSKMKRAMRLIGKTFEHYGDQVEVLEVGVYPGGYNQDNLYVCGHDFLGARLRHIQTGREIMVRLSARLNFTHGDKKKK